MKEEKISFDTHGFAFSVTPFVCGYIVTVVSDIYSFSGNMNPKDLLVAISDVEKVARGFMDFASCVRSMVFNNGVGAFNKKSDKPLKVKRGSRELRSSKK
jgi:hypothetical protein